MMPSYMEPRCINVERAAVIHKELDIPCVVVGNINTIDAAENILANDQASIVAMARSFLADPAQLKKAYRDETDKIRPCLRCIECAARPAMGGGVRCSVNPSLGRETKYDYIPKADEKKKVLIIGGGPSGMQAAQTATLRGHEVVLYEKEDKLGGRLKEASVLFKKEDTHRAYLAWSIRETENLDAKIVLGTEVTPEIIAAEKPDVIINAAGGVPFAPPIKGIDNPKVEFISDVDNKRVPVGKKVVLMGGGLAGLEGAIQLAYEGHEVTIIDMLPKDKLWREIMDELRSGLIEYMEKYEVGLVDDASITEVTDAGVKYRKSSGEEGIVEGDTFVAAFGIRPNKDFNNRVLDIMPEVYTIGDARKARNIFWANQDGFNVAVEL
jgi:NADPH-dependent 2,4-dienoyl-CoA reductase/sulfur reductase-like enzyme